MVRAKRNIYWVWQLAGVVGLMLMVAGNTGPSCGPSVDPQQPACAQHADCEALGPCDGQWSCTAGACLCQIPIDPTDCQSDSDCVAGQVCQDGRCTEPIVVDCYSDADCGIGKRCEIDWQQCGTVYRDFDCSDDRCATLPTDVCGGRCVTPEPECWSDQDCGTGMYCAIDWQTCGAADQPVDCDGTDCGVPAMQACGGICQAVDTNCYEDADCGTGMRCEIAWDRCATYDDSGARDCDSQDCSPDQPVSPRCGGVCVPVQAQCYSEGDCGPGMHCEIDWNNCAYPVPMPDCQSDDCKAEAAEAMVACGGSCVPIQYSCYGDEECGTGMRCEIDWNNCAYPVPYPSCENGACDAGAADRMVACGGYCVPVQYDCYSDWDCGSGMACQIDWNTCGASYAEPNCSADGYCGDVACGGYCIPVAAECYSDVDCGTGMRCEIAWDRCYSYDPMPCEQGMDCGVPVTPACGGVCVPLAYECYGDADCGTGMICQIDWDNCYNDSNCGPDTNCGAMACGGYCVQVTPVCYADSDCGAGMRCEIDWATCEQAPPPCLPDEPCDVPEYVPCTGFCVAIEYQCYSDWDCGDGMTCQIDWNTCYNEQNCDAAGNCGTTACGGYCVAIATRCYSDADCAAGELCQIDWSQCAYGNADPNGDVMPCTGVCVVQPPAECRNDVDCPEGLVCQFDANCPYGSDGQYLPECLGVCVVPAPTYECSYDAECGQGMRCEWDVCDDPGFPGAATDKIMARCYGHCVPVVPERCAADSECPANYRCDLQTTSQCEANCTPDSCTEFCYGTCTPTLVGCAGNFDCPEDMFCAVLADEGQECYWPCEQSPDGYCMGGEGCLTACIY